MDEKPSGCSELVQLARLALAGRRQDIQTYVRRLAMRHRTSEPELTEQLTALLRKSPTRMSPLRDGTVTAIPVDADSRLQLLRFEDPPKLHVDPIWTEAVRRGLEQIVTERRCEDDLTRAGLSPTRSAIFTGPSGVGKTLAARWIAIRLERPMFLLDLSAVMSSFLGRTGANVRYVLDYAKHLDCVLLLDELDAIAKRRDDATEIGELKRLVTVLLQEIDDWPPNSLLIAATNHPDLLDPAVWRRFEMRVEFPMPEDEHVREAVRSFLGSDDAVPPAWQDALAVILQGLSFSDIERELIQLRREAIVHEQPLEDHLKHLVRERLIRLSRQDRRKIAATLATSGVSQRQIHEITGVSRDTIRKALTRRAVP